MQGRSEVRWRPRQETSLAPPYSNLSLSEVNVFKKVLGTFRRPGNCAPLVTPLAVRCNYGRLRLQRMPRRIMLAAVCVIYCARLVHYKDFTGNCTTLR